MVKHHDFVRDIGLKAVIGVGKRGKSVGHFFYAFTTMEVEGEEFMILGLSMSKTVTSQHVKNDAIGVHKYYGDAHSSFKASLLALVVSRDN